MASLFGQVDRVWSNGERGTSADHAAFAAHARHLTAVNLEVTALIIVGLSALAWPTDALIFPSGSAAAAAVLSWRVALLVVCGVAYAVLRTAPRVSPEAVGLVAYAAVMAASGALMARAGGLESPLFYGIYTAPLMTVMLIVGLPLRVGATAVVVVCYLVAFFVADPSHLHHPQVGTPLVWLVASAVTAVVVGQVVTHLLRVNFIQRQALDRRACALDDLTERLEQRVAEQTAALRELAADITRGQEQERLRISRELHDELGQLLAGMQMELEWVRDRVERGAPDVSELGVGIARVGALLEATNDAVDVLVSEIRPRALEDAGLLAALHVLTGELKARFGVACEIHSELDEERLDEVGTIATYRIVQEALVNVGRHARARSAAVLIAPDGDDCCVRVSDDGVGFDPNAPAAPGHFGHVGMRERARVLGGQCTITSAIGAGTIVDVRFPLPVALRKDGSAP